MNTELELSQNNKLYTLLRLSNEHLGTVYAIVSGMLYGLLGYFGISIIQENISVYNMLFWRFLISSLFIGILVILRLKQYQNKQQNIQQNEQPDKQQQRQQYHQQDNPKALFKVLACGFIFYGIGSLFYFFASRYIGTGLAMVIFFCHPAFVLFINSVFFKAQITKIYFLSVGLILLGLILLIDLHELKLDVLGIGLAIISSVFYALYIVASKKYKVSPLNSTLMVCLGSTLSAAALSIINNSLVLPQSFSAWFNIFGIAIICTAVPILFLLQALKYISSEKVAILSVLEPICVLLFGMLLLGEKITMMQMVGSCIVLMAALLTIKKVGS